MNREIAIRRGEHFAPFLEGFSHKREKALGIDVERDLPADEMYDCSAYRWPRIKTGGRDGHDGLERCVKLNKDRKRAKFFGPWLCFHFISHFFLDDEGK